MSEIQATPRTPDPIRILTDAINLAVAQEIEVSTSADLGVICLSTVVPRWELDPRARSVSALGAVLLAHQPPVASVDRALTHVLGVGPIWTEAFEDGCSGCDPEQNQLSRGAGARLYADGHMMGLQFRAFIATAVCQPHGIRYQRGGRCWRCNSAVPVERPLDEITRPALIADRPAPQTLIRQLLASLTLADALEAVAATVPGRRWPAETKVDIIEDLRELAAAVRGMGL